jgi:hypothetical protein
MLETRRSGESSNVKDVTVVRTIDHRTDYGVGLDRHEWFVFTRSVAHGHGQWQKHCGPFGSFEEGRSWILAIREAA